MAMPPQCLLLSACCCPSPYSAPILPTPAQAFTRMLHIIPLTMVESRKEVDDIKELVTICKEYHIALRCELRRKELKVRDLG